MEDLLKIIDKIVEDASKSFKVNKIELGRHLYDLVGKQIKGLEVIPVDNMSTFIHVRAISTTFLGKTKEFKEYGLPEGIINKYAKHFFRRA